MAREKAGKAEPGIGPLVFGAGLGTMVELLTAPIPRAQLQWRQQGKPSGKEGRYIARFVTYIDAGVVRERFDAAVPGRWSLRTRLVEGTHADMDGVQVVVVEAVIGVLLDDGTWVERSDYGEGKSAKAAASDAFKRAAVRWGVGHELYDLPMLWVKMDGDGKYAKPLEDPAAVFARKMGPEHPAGRRGSSEATSEGALAKGEVIASMEALIEELRDVLSDQELWSEEERAKVDEYLMQTPGPTREKLAHRVAAAKTEAKRRSEERAGAVQ